MGISRSEQRRPLVLLRGPATRTFRGLACILLLGSVLAPPSELSGNIGSSVLAEDHQAPAWKIRAPQPTPREGLGAAVVGNTAFAIGGYAGRDTAINESYDIGSDQWTTRASAPTPRSDLAVVSDGRFIYALGGRDLSRDLVLQRLERFDPISETWVTLAAMPTARAGLGAAIVGGVLYAIGGRNNPRMLSGTPLNTVEAYDIAKNSWVARTPMPTARMDIQSTVAAADKVYVIGGYDPDRGGMLNNVEAYDPVKDQWSTAAPMPTRRSNLAAVTCRDVIVAVGGLNDDNDLLRTAEIYDPRSNTWRSHPPMETGRAAFAAVSNGTQVLVIGGGTFGSLQSRGSTELLELPVQPDQVCMNFDSFPDGTAVAPLTLINRQYLSYGVIFSSTDPTADGLTAIPVTPCSAPNGVLAGSRLGQTLSARFVDPGTPSMPGMTGFVSVTTANNNFGISQEPLIAILDDGSTVIAQVDFTKGCNTVIAAAPPGRTIVEARLKTSGFVDDFCFERIRRLERCIDFDHLPSGVAIAPFAFLNTQFQTQGLLLSSGDPQAPGITTIPLSSCSTPNAIFAGKALGQELRVRFIMPGSPGTQAGTPFFSLKTNNDQFGGLELMTATLDDGSTLTAHLDFSKACNAGVINAPSGRLITQVRVRTGGFVDDLCFGPVMLPPRTGIPIKKIPDGR
ncbi:MAG: hypothetical protein HY650_00035 [Acidobacteria bacterium]|nr:hypothetical protein [Acidobacteriota bacterium]